MTESPNADQTDQFTGAVIRQVRDIEPEAQRRACQAIARGERVTARKHLRLYRQMQRWQQQREGQQ